MILNNIAKTILFNPLSKDVNELYIVSGYATPTMLSWYIKNLYHKTQAPIKIYLLVGMLPFDGISVSVHEGFIHLMQDELPPEIERLECSYIYDAPAVYILTYLSGPRMVLPYLLLQDQQTLCRVLLLESTAKR